MNLTTTMRETGSYNPAFENIQKTEIIEKDKIKPRKNPCIGENNYAWGTCKY